PPSLVSPFFLLTLRPPLTSTLFPYTTLFRSRPRARRRRGVRARRRHDRSHRAAGALRQSLLRRRQAQPPVHGREPVDLCALRQQDRKSTRLNSSHVKISYAVFCLKKKKKKTK